MSDWRFGAAPPAGSIAELRRGETMVPRCRPECVARRHLQYLAKVLRRHDKFP
jgi:hypothetical protein